MNGYSSGGVRSPNINDESIYFYIADLMGFCQDVSKTRMKTAIAEADELSKVEEADARRKYKEAVDEASSAYSKDQDGTPQITGWGWAMIGTLIAITVVSTAVGFCIGLPIAGALTGTAMIAVLGSFTLGGAFAGCLFAGCAFGLSLGIQQIVNIANGSWDSKDFLTFLSGGDNNVDANGNSKTILGILTLATSVGQLIDPQKLKDAEGKENLYYSKIQDIQREISIATTVSYPEAQNDSTSEQDNIRKIMQDYSKLTS